jgi:hypothetical protein
MGGWVGVLYERCVGIGTSQTSDLGDRGETRLGSQKYGARSEQGGSNRRGEASTHGREGEGRAAARPAQVRQQATA